jgi:hypothetical protein
VSNCEISPVALFVFNRPELTAQVYERIRAARPSRLLIVADGPRSDRQGEAELCMATRAIVTTPDWPCELQINFAQQNLGCRGRMSSGIDWVFAQCPEAIILEDDCLPDPSFFSFCTQMLARYRDDDRIMHISGDNFQDGIRRGTASYFFSRYSLSWGWASWRRAWKHYDVQISTWPQSFCAKWLESILDGPKEVRYWDDIFDRQYLGKIDTWDYQWLYACWRNGGLAIQPNVNLVSNIGVGPDATHFKEGHTTIGIPTGELGPLSHPEKVVRDRAADQYTFEEHIAIPQSNPPELLLKLKQRLRIRATISSILPRSRRYQ